MMNNGRPTVTKHMVERCQQRGISRDVVELLLKYGKRQYSRGGISYAMDKRARRRARICMGGSVYSRLDGQLDCFVVVSLDGTRLLTAAHRHRRYRA